ncbi:MAG: dockerin type I domain-containing protein [Planctomycetota bacterium]
MQREFDLHYPSLGIEILGVNEDGYDSANANITAGRDIPWLQDVDADSNGVSDVWYDSWGITYRDVWVLDTDNEVVLKYNLTSNSLGDAANYDTLKSAFVDAAVTPPDSVWQNPVEPLDINADQQISPLDALLVINNLGVFPDGVPPQGMANTNPYVDPTGDGIVTPLDALVVINQVNEIASQSSAAPAAALSSGVSFEDEAETNDPAASYSPLNDYVFAEMDDEADVEESRESSAFEQVWAS